MSTHVCLTDDDFDGRISLGASGACAAHLEFVRDGTSVDIGVEDIAELRFALAVLEEFDRNGHDAAKAIAVARGSQ